MDNSIKKEKKKKPIPKAEVCLILGDKKYNSSAETIEEALENLKVDKITTWGVFRIKTSDGGSTEMRFKPVMIKRFLINRIARQIFQKRALSALVYNGRRSKA